MALARTFTGTSEHYNTEMAVWAIYFVVFIDIFQMTFVVPFLAPLVERMPNGSVKMIVIIETVNFAASALGQPLLGGFSDRVGRRPVLLVSQLGSTASCAVLGLASRFWMLVVARAINGISGATNAMAFSYIGDVSSRQELDARNARLTAAIGLGACVGPLFGSLLYSLGGINVACLSAAGINLLSVMCICFVLPEEKTTQTETGKIAQQPDPEAGQDRGDSEEAAKPTERLPPAVWFLIAARGLQGPMKAIFSTFVNPYVTARLFEGDEHKGTLFFQITLTVSSAVVFLVLILFYKRLVACIGLRVVLFLALVAGVLGGVFNGVVFPSAPWLFSVGYTLWVVGFQLFTPAIQTFIAKLSPPSRLGLANGLASGCNSIAIAITPFAMWPLYDVEPAGVFFVLGALFVPIAVIAFAVDRKVSHQHREEQREAQGRQIMQCGGDTSLSEFVSEHNYVTPRAHTDLPPPGEFVPAPSAPSHTSPPPPEALPPSPASSTSPKSD